MRKLLAIAALVIAVVALDAAPATSYPQHPADTGIGFATTHTYPRPTGIYYHVKVDASVAPYYWHIWNAAQDVYTQSGIVLYVDPPNTPASAAPGSINIRAEAGQEAGYCAGGYACAGVALDGNRIVGGTMLLQLSNVWRNPEGSIRHEFGHLLGLAHYPYYLMQPALPDWATRYAPADVAGLVHQRSNGCIAWFGGIPC